MTGFSPQMEAGPFILTGLIQGFGMGFVFVPLSTIAFATLPPQLRLEGSSLFNLVRNLGSSVGISMVMTVLVKSVQISHEELGAAFTPFTSLPPNGLIDGAALAAGNPQLVSILNALVTQQAAMIGYLDAFKFMLMVCLGSLPLLIFLRRSNQGVASLAGAPPALD